MGSTGIARHTHLGERRRCDLPVPFPFVAFSGYDIVPEERQQLILFERFRKARAIRRDFLRRSLL